MENIFIALPNTTEIQHITKIPEDFVRSLPGEVITITDPIITFNPQFQYGIYEFTKKCYAMLKTHMEGNVSKLYRSRAQVHCITDIFNYTHMPINMLPNNIYFHKTKYISNYHDVYEYNPTLGFSASIHTFLKFVQIYKYLDIQRDRPLFYSSIVVDNTIITDNLVKNWMHINHINAISMEIEKHDG